MFYTSLGDACSQGCGIRQRTVSCIYPVSLGAPFRESPSQSGSGLRGANRAGSGGVVLGVRGSSGPRGGRGLLGVTPAWGAQRSNTEPRGVGTGGREVKKHRTTAGGQGQGESGRGGGGRCRGTSRERHSAAVPSAGGQGGHSTGPSGHRGTARSPGSCRAPGCPSLGITQHITHFWAVLAAPHGIVTQMI